MKQDTANTSRGTMIVTGGTRGVGAAICELAASYVSGTNLGVSGAR